MAYNTTMTTYMANVYGLSDSQITAISNSKRIMGAVSVLGSGFIIVDVLRDPRKRNHTLHRLMVGLSVLDILSSFFAHVLSTTPMPAGYHMLAIGSVATCDAQGFITTLTGFGIPLYNCSLATYYLVQLKYNWVDRRIKALEKWLHIVPWVVGIVGAAIGLAFNTYGPFGFTCGPTPAYPLSCFEDESQQCVRGGYRMYLCFLVAFYITAVLSICYVSITMYRVYRTISDIETQAIQYSFRSLRSQATFRMRSRRVMIQGVLYSAVLILIHLVPSIVFFRSLLGLKSGYSLRLLMYIFWPLQGFFNALIYKFPAWHKRRGEKIKQQTKKKRNEPDLNDSGSKSIGRTLWLSLFPSEGIRESKGESFESSFFRRTWNALLIGLKQEKENPIVSDRGSLKVSGSTGKTHTMETISSGENHKNNQTVSFNFGNDKMIPHDGNIESSISKSNHQHHSNLELSVSEEDTEEFPVGVEANTDIKDVFQEKAEVTGPCLRLSQQSIDHSSNQIFFDFNPSDVDEPNDDDDDGDEYSEGDDYYRLSLIVNNFII